MLTRFLAAGTASICCLSHHAIAQDFAVDAGIGTTGIRANLQMGVNDWLALRGGYNWLEFDRDDQTYDDITYDAELDFTTLGAFADLHPFKNGFTVTGGIYHGDKDVNLLAMPTENVVIGGATFTPDQVGTLSGAASLEKTAPYVGIGWDGALYSENRISFYGRLGVMFTGSPDVTLTTSGGTLSDDPNLQDELAEEEQNIQDDVDGYELYPVISVGVSFRL